MGFSGVGGELGEAPFVLAAFGTEECKHSKGRTFNVQQHTVL